MNIGHFNADAYRKKARSAVDNQTLQQALMGLQQRFGRGTARTYRRFPEGPALRQRGHAIRMQTIEHLDRFLVALTEKITQNGGQVFFADHGRSAVDYCLRVARENGVKQVVKGKSMVTEEIALNSALQAAGIEVTETDLGEYIVQLAGESPSHIITPAIHKNRKDVGRLFAEKLGIEYTDDPPRLTRAARKALRRKFLTADMGISGCNLACAETGHISVVSNEGNIRMASSLPRIHVAVMGMERICATLADHAVLLRLLCAGAVAQKMGTYVSFIGGPALPDHVDGPDQFHLIILDNGRSHILADPDFREMLCCIRCAACLNVCPVYGKIGGHAYGFAYSGPVGAVLTPLLVGINRARHLCQGETLCGACKAACPVDIDIPGMLLKLRQKLAEGDRRWQVRPASRLENAAFQIWAWMVQDRRRYQRMTRFMRSLQVLLPRQNGMLSYLPPPFAGWTRSRLMPPLAAQSFSERWQR